jgi:hypothetical protein
VKHCAANRKRRLSALPNVGPYIYDVKISGFTRSSIYFHISRLRVKSLHNITMATSQMTRRAVHVACGREEMRNEQDEVMSKKLGPPKICRRISENDSKIGFYRSVICE